MLGTLIRRFLILTGCTFALVLLPVYGADRAVEAKSWRQYTSPQQERESEALARYAWAFYLAIDGDSKSAVDEMIKAVNANPESEYLLGALLQLLNKRRVQSEEKLLIDRLTELASANPGARGLNLILANSHLRLGHYKEAELILERLFAHIGWDSGVLIRELAICYSKTDRTSDAHRLFQDATGNDRLRGNFIVEQAAAVFYDSLAADEKSSRRKRVRYRELAFTHAFRAIDEVGPQTHAADAVVLARMMLRVRYDDEALRILEGLDRHGSWLPESEQLRAEIYEQRMQEGRAIEVWYKIARHNRFYPGAYLRIAQIHRGLEQPEYALPAYDKAVRVAIDPRETDRVSFEAARYAIQLGHYERALRYTAHARVSPARYFIEGLALFRKGDLTAARSRLEKTVKTAATGPRRFKLNSGFYMILAQVYYGLGLHKETIETLESAIKLHPDSAELANFLGYYLADRNEQLPRAEKLIRLAVDKEPENIAYLDSMAWVLYRKGQFTEAAEVMGRVIASLKRPDAEILDHAAEIQLALGKVLIAADYLTQAAAAAPDNLMLAARLKRLLENIEKRAEQRTPAEK
jgi:tetratricopeptide (TPR) repeat protein